MTSLLKKLFKKKEAVPLSVQYQTPRRASEPFLFNNPEKLFQDVEYHSPNHDHGNDVFEDELISPREISNKGGEFSLKVEMDVMEDDNYYLLNLVTPGITSEQINIEVVKDIITISGHIKQITRLDEKLHKSERLYGKFGRSVHLPKNIDKHNIQATIKHGVLTVKIPKVKGK